MFHTAKILADIPFKIEDYQVVIEGETYHVDAETVVYPWDNEDFSKYEFDRPEIGVISRASDLQELNFYEDFGVEARADMLAQIHALIKQDTNISDAIELHLNTLG